VYVLVSCSIKNDEKKRGTAMVTILTPSTKTPW